MTDPTTYLEEPTALEMTNAVRALRAAVPDRGLFAFVCEKDAPSVATLQEVAVAEACPLVGGIVPGLVVHGGFRRRGVLLSSFDGGAPRRIVAMPRVDGKFADAAISELADFVTANASPDGTDSLLLLVDTTLGDIGEIVDRLYQEVGDMVGYVGTCVGSETFVRMPCVFDERTFAAGALVAVLLRGHPGASMAHHYRGGDALWVATTTTGGRIAAIDGRPAFDVYRELVQREYGVAIDRENFYRYGVHFPLALNRGQGEPLVRIPIQVEDDGSVFCSGDVPENTLLSVVRAIPRDDLGAAEAVGAGACAGVDVGSAVLTFYCAGRFLHLDEAAATREITALEAAIHPRPLFGVLSLGEIGSPKQTYPAFHNATIVAMPWS
ncbi:MAG: FIST C-terminal domain-containing protein [Polyangiaceae bacterium]